MPVQTQYEFASPEWVAAYHGYLLAKIPALSESLDGRPFSVCEIFTDVPTSVNPAGRSVVHWSIIDGSLTFDHEETTDVELHVLADWATMKPMALLLTTAGPDQLAKAQEDAAKAMADGKMVVTARSESPAHMLEVHDDMAVITS